MKRIILMTVILAAMSISCDNDDSPNVETPSVVLNTFQREFPDATDVEWEKLQQDYEVEFEVDNIDHTAILSNDGNLLKYKYDILISELPGPITAIINTNYESNEIDDTEILIIDGVTYYQVEFERTLKDEQVVFNVSGEVNPDIEYLD
ncbi:hypothetical protein [uncultured Christiangramia sp.]|uniref:hypothetical protein n=1 Tax=Christiangramia sp. 3-2217-3z TaxID=3417564 RepID=UPI00262E21DE|nr:hypothetical protein [uncultured Christiangramia sp.]